jgi:Cu2+-exporting ATPase
MANTILRGVASLCGPGRRVSSLAARQPSRWRAQRWHPLLRLHRSSATSSGGRRALSCSRQHAGHPRHLSNLTAPRAAATDAATAQQQQQPEQQQQRQPPQQPPEPEPVQTVLLDVGGMKCGGCSAAVKRMLSQRPEVASAAVNLLTETAAVQLRLPPACPAEDLAAMLSAKGFPSRVRQAEQGAGDAAGLEGRRAEQARASLASLGVAWALALACGTHHAGHLLHSMGLHGLAHSPALELLSNPLVSDRG